MCAFALMPSFHPIVGYGYVGASLCKNAAGLHYFQRLRRTDWLPIGGKDSDEESDRADASDAESLDPYDGWCGDGSDSDCSTLRSDGHLQPSDDEDFEVDEDGNYREIDEDYSAVGQGFVSFLADQEPEDACADLFGAKRRRW